MIPKRGEPFTDAHKIRCDSCRRWSWISDAARDTPEEIRNTAAKSGWTHDGERDVCPVCTRKEAAA